MAAPSNGGTYQGDGTLCTPDPCGSSGVCCRGATCSTTTSGQCTTGTGTAGAAFVGSGTCGTSNSTPCCYGDYNKLNGISVQDIFDFLSDWFAGNPYAHTGGDGSTGVLSVQNIFDFLSAHGSAAADRKCISPHARLAAGALVESGAKEWRAPETGRKKERET